MGNLPLFRVAGIQVAVSLTYLILIGWYIFGGGGMLTGAIWGASITVSLLVHEFGHALVARHYRLNPHIVLWGLGGLTYHDRAAEDRDDAFIIAAGPAAGIVFGLLTLLVWQFVGTGGWPGLFDAADVTEYVFGTLAWINIFWSFVNLLPAWPLDGGQLFRLAVMRFTANTAKAERIVHTVGSLLAGGAMFWAWSTGSTFLIILAALLLWQNAQHFLGPGGSGSARSAPARRTTPAVREALDAGWTALAADNPREAARQGHVARSFPKTTRREMDEIWRLLGLATTALGEYDEALSYLERASDTDEVVRARERCRSRAG